jgi:hypothetical protein
MRRELVSTAACTGRRGFISVHSCMHGCVLAVGYRSVRVDGLTVVHRDRGHQVGLVVLGGTDDYGIERRLTTTRS